MKAMVLAAGVGTRLDPLTTQLPKPLVPVVNKPVMEHVLSLLVHHNFKQVSVNLHYLPELIRKHFGDGSQFGAQLNYLFEENLSGDAGGVRGCRQHLQDGTFLVIMGDLLTNANLTNLVAEHKKMGALATIALKEVKDVSQFGVAVLNQLGWITEFQEKPAPHEARSNLVSTGIYIFQPEIFNFIPETGVYGFGKQLFPQLIKNKKKILGVAIEDYWSDVGTIDQYRQANFDTLSGKYAGLQVGDQIPEDAWTLCQGKEAIIDSGCQINGQLLVGNNSLIKRGAKIYGSVIIGDNCLVEEDVSIEDAIIWSGSKIGSRSKIKQSILGLDSLIEPETVLNESVFVTPQSAVRFEPPSKFPSTTSNKRG